MTTAAIWFHDATEHDNNSELERMQQFKYGICIDCGVGLDNVEDFFYDRREKHCDCLTCNACFETIFGESTMFECIHWKTLGHQIPQYIRLSEE
jgi:hypothetical protein